MQGSFAQNTGLEEKTQLYEVWRQQTEALQREALGKKEDGEGEEAPATAHHLPDPEGHQGIEAQLDCNCCHVFLILMQFV